MSDNNQIDRQGVVEVNRQVLKADLFFREQFNSDIGIDAQIEIKGGEEAGRLIAVQIKSGLSWFKKEGKNKTGFWYCLCDRHKKLWLEHSLPVIIILHDPKTETCYYELVTEENCISTGKGWKIFIPRNKTLTASSRKDLIEIASPIVALSDLTVELEKDQSYLDIKRISLDVTVHPSKKAITKPFLGSIIRTALKIGQDSTYTRNEISEKRFEGKPTDVVWGYIYLREIDRKRTLWTCMFQWISPKLERKWWPSVIEGESNGNGLIIDWNSKTEIARYLDKNRATKKNYLAQTDVLLNRLPEIQKILNDLVQYGEKSPFADKFARETETFEKNWDGRRSAPSECQQLDQVIQEILAIVGNSGIIWKERDKRDIMNVLWLIKKDIINLKKLSDKVRHYLEDIR